MFFIFFGSGLRAAFFMLQSFIGKRRHQRTINFSFANNRP